MPYSKDLAASVLIEAAFQNDDKAAAKYGISLRTVRNYRCRLQTDPELAAIFQTKKAIFDRVWADDLLRALRGAADFICEAAQSARADEKCKTNPEMIAAMAGALKLCADVHLTSRVLDARLANTNRAENGLSSEVSPANSVEYSC